MAKKIEKIGQTTEEIDANLIFECRQIVKNIVNFGVKEQQKIKIIELLSLELESRDAMQLILETVKKIKKMDDNVKFSLTIDDNDYNKNKLLDT
jgi:hypothetical protein